MVSFIIEREGSLRGLRSIRIAEHTEVDASPEDVQEVIDLFTNAEAVKKERDKFRELLLETVVALEIANEGYCEDNFGVEIRKSREALKEGV